MNPTWFLIAQLLAADGVHVDGPPYVKLFKDEESCKTELSVIKDDPPPILAGRVLSCHPVMDHAISTPEVFPMGRPRVLLPPEGIPPPARFVFVASAEATAEQKPVTRCIVQEKNGICHQYEILP